MNRIIDAIRQAREDYHRLKGGAGSGNFGHSGRPGKRGGSAPGTGGGIDTPDGAAAAFDNLLNEQKWGAYVTRKTNPQRAGTVEYRIGGDKAAQAVRGALEQSGYKYEDNAGNTSYYSIPGSNVGAAVDLNKITFGMYHEL